MSRGESLQPRCPSWNHRQLSERLNTYLRDVLQRLPEHPARRLEHLLPHRWQPQA